MLVSNLHSIQLKDKQNGAEGDSQMLAWHKNVLTIAQSQRARRLITGVSSSIEAAAAQTTCCSGHFGIAK